MNKIVFLQFVVAGFLFTAVTFTPCVSFSQNAECSRLFSQLKAVDPSKAESFGDLAAIKAKRQKLREEYELRCLSGADRSEAEQQRSNQNTRRQLNQIQQTQREIQDRQRGYTY